MEGKRSCAMKEAPTKAVARALFKAAGYTDDEIAKPLIGIVSSWSESFPGHCHLDKLADAVSDGVYAAGGTPMQFSTIAICDGFCNAMEGMKYSLPSREVIADSIECMANAHYYDGLVFVCSCDKIVPGMLMAACRLDIPCIFINGGPMLPGKFRGERYDLTSLGKAAVDFVTGKSDEKTFKGIESCALPGCGSCAGMFTANSMGCMTEVLGLALPGNGTIPAIDAARVRLAKDTGKMIMKLVRDDVKPSDIITYETFENAITLDMLIGCSTNTTIHLPAIAHELGIKVTWDDFERIGEKTPAVCHISPAGPFHLVDFNEAGGMQALMKEALDGGLLHENCKTILGMTLKEQLADIEVINSDIIRSLDNPYLEKAGLTILKGNLCPEGAVVKANAVDRDQFIQRGVAKVYNSEKEATAGLYAGEIKKGTCVVIRYEGPKGGPGMQEMAIFIAIMQAYGYDDGVFLVTDGRFSGVTRGASIGHVVPEAFDGGPIALIQDGDIVELNIEDRTLNVLISDDEMAERKKNWVRPEPRYTKGYLAKYAASVSPATEGAITNK